MYTNCSTLVYSCEKREPSGSVLGCDACSWIPIKHLTRRHIPAECNFYLHSRGYGELPVRYLLFASAYAPRKTENMPRKLTLVVKYLT
jgi:hypothetical protein